MMLEIRRVAPGDAPQIVRLAKVCLGATWNEAYVHWKYFRFPATSVESCCAELNGELVGFYGALPVRIKVGDSILHGAQAVDWMVAPKVRRQGLLVQLANWADAHAPEAGPKLAYATPNPISRAGAVKHLGWEYAGEIPRYVRVIQPFELAATVGLRGPTALAYGLFLRAILLAKVPKSQASAAEISVREVPTIDERFDGLWEQAAGVLRVAVLRDCTYLTWRYVENPLVPYTILIAERGEALRGYLVLSHADRAKGVVAVAELLVAPGDEAAGLALLATAKVRAQQLGAVQLQCWMLPQHRFHTSLLQASGFLFANSRYLPGVFCYTTSFMVKLKHMDTLSSDPRLLDSWFITMGDQDYF
jgi:GNAT superfamily N-acetyltransferase